MMRAPRAPYAITLMPYAIATLLCQRAYAAIFAMIKITLRDVIDFHCRVVRHIAYAIFDYAMPYMLCLFSRHAR